MNLRGGTYLLSAPITFDAGDSGTNGHTVVYQAYNGETPVITRGKAVTGWTPAANGEYKVSVGGLNFRQLYVDGARAPGPATPTSARTPGCRAGTRPTSSPGRASYGPWTRAQAEGSGV